MVQAGLGKRVSGDRLRGGKEGKNELNDYLGAESEDSQRPSNMSAPETVKGEGKTGEMPRG